MKRLVSIAMLTLLLTSMLTLTLNIRPVTASGTIYIKADGSIDPPTANITSSDNVTYAFSDDNFDQIVIQRNNIVVDANGYTLHGSGVVDSIGMDVSNWRSNVTIKNARIEGFWIGVRISDSSSCNVVGNDVVSIGRYGILLWTSTGNNIIGNNVTNNAPTNINNCGIYLGGGANSNNVSANNVTGSNWGGIYVDGASNNRFSENIFVSCGVFLGYDPYHNIAENNLVNDKPLVYLEDKSNIVVGDAGQVILVNCANMTVRNLDLSDTSVGVELWACSNSTIAGNFLSANSMSNVMLWSSSGNNVSRNVIKGSLVYGVYLWYSSSNMIYHNTIYNNFAQAIAGPSGYGNTWDDGYPSGGNYWGDYNGTDVYSGPYQNETGSDGIGDVPYVVESSNHDDYPLMETYAGLHDIGITYGATSKAGCLPMPTIGQGYTVDVNVTVANYGDYVEIFNVTTYANETVIARFENITVESGNSTTITFAWNTTEFAKGNCTLMSYAEPVENETDTLDNTFLSWIIITIPGDVNGDGTVNILDSITIANSFLAKPKDWNWNPNADINCDEVINILDSIVIGNHFLEHYP